jgi:hypothetical protein
MERTMWLMMAGVLLVCRQLAAADSRPGPVSADAALETLEKSHPRLILKEDRLADLKKLAERDELLKKIVQDSIRQADDICTRAKPLVYEKIGPRLLQVSRDCLRRIYALGLAWRLTGKEVYAEKAKECLLAVCEFKDWNPSHFLDTAEMSHAVGVGYDWFFPYLDAKTKEKIKAALIEKGLNPGIAVYSKGGWWAASLFNWNQVCNGGMIIGALAIAETAPQYARTILPAAVASLPKALASYEPDGAWAEGPGYWHYATSYTVYALAALETALGKDFGLSQSKGLSEAGFFPIYTAGPTGMNVNFADAGMSRLRPTACLFWLAKRYDKPALALTQKDLLGRYGGGPLDFIWYYTPAVAKVAPPELDKLFRGTVELAIFRSSWTDPNALFVSVKAGYNQVNHGHLDLGQFELDALGERWARDLGSDDYNMPGYWDSKQGGKRWTYYRLGSLSHNVPLLDNQNQHAEGVAKMVKFRSEPNAALAVIEFASAYKGFAGSAMRGVALVQDRSAVLVQDEFDLSRKCELAWGLTTDAEIAADKALATLKLKDRKLTAQILSPSGAEFTVESAERQPPEKDNKGVRRLMIRLKDQSGPVRVAVLLRPVASDAKPPEPPKVKPLADW